MASSSALRGYSVADKPRVFVGGENLNRARFLRESVSFALRRNVKRKALFEAGLGLGTVEVEERLGLDFAPRTDHVRTAFARAIWDRLDDRFQPKEGGRVELVGEWNAPGLGASLDYWRS